jgi:hypothetical protein
MNNFKAIIIKLNLIIICALGALSTHAQTILTGGDISGVLTKKGSPYQVTGDLRIPKDTSLVIEAGVVIDFDSAKLIRVDGSIHTLGTKNEPIVLTCSDSLLGWLGLFFVDNMDQDTSWFNYTKIEYIGIPRNIIHSPFFNDIFHSNGSTYSPSAFAAHTASPIRFNYCNFRRNWSSQNGWEADVEFRNCEFYQNLDTFGKYTNGGIGSMRKSHYSMYDCYFHDNKTNRWGASENLSVSNPGEIINCRFENNPKLASIFQDTRHKIRRCIWRNNGCSNMILNGVVEVEIDSCLFSGSGVCSRGAHLYIVGNALNSVVMNCEFLGIDDFMANVYCSDASPLFLNCEFRNNQGAISNETGSSNGRYVNCLFTGNDISINTTSDIDVVNCAFVNNKIDKVYNESWVDANKVTSAIQTRNSAKLRCYNSIFWNNRNYYGNLVNHTVVGSTVNHEFRNCIIEGMESSFTKYADPSFSYSGELIDCDSLYPHFVDTSMGDFRIKMECTGPPVVFNKGYKQPIRLYYNGKWQNDIFSVLTTDLPNNARVYDGRPDIGPYEVQALAHRIDIVDTLNDLKVCAGLDATLPARANSVGIKYEWESSTNKTDWMVLGNSTPNLQLNPASLLDSGTYYRVNYSNKCGVNEASKIALLSVHQPVQVNLKDYDSVQQHKSIQFDAGSGFTSYLWSNQSTEQIATYYANDYGLGQHNIWVQVIDTNGCSSGDTVLLSVIRNASIGSIGPGGLNVYPNPAKQQLHIVGVSHGDYTITDLFGKVILNGQYTGAPIDISTITAIGSYIIRITENNQTVQTRWLKTN